MSYVIRSACPEDLAAIVSIYCSDPDFLLHHLGRGEVDRAFILRDQREMREHGFLSCVVEDEAGEVVGVLDYRPGGEVYLCLLLIGKAFRGGTGRGVYRVFEKQMKDRGADTIRLDVVNDHAGNALPFWEKLGYIPGEQLRLHWGEKTSNMTVMWKKL